MKYKKWLIGWLVMVTIMLIVIGGFVYKVDPYFHYHAPDTEKYYYSLNNERSQNNGIVKHFDYDALITGTSMTENFKTSEFDDIFGVKSVKTAYSGGTYKEINDNLDVALKSNPQLQTVVRSLDYSLYYLLNDKDGMRTDLGEYPTYLYDDNPFNDVFYLFNKDVIFSRAYAMVAAARVERVQPGITSFDSYCRWQEGFTFGRNSIIPEGIWVKPGEAVHLTDEEKYILYDNITQNVTSLADEYPEVDFYYFFPPYSAAWWAGLVYDGTIYKQVEAEKYVIELILDHPNIKLYSFNNCTDITTNLNYYKDVSHYGDWVNSYMLKAMHEGKCLLTKENYKKYIQEELDFYVTFDYNSLNEQEDYEDDSYAGVMLDGE